MNIKGYVPVEVQGNRDYLWYLSVLNLNLSELLELSIIFMLIMIIIMIMMVLDIEEKLRKKLRLER